MGMSEAAVRRRVKNLVRQGIIRKFTVDLQASQIASALTLVAVTPGSPTSEVANKIKLLDNVSKVNEITGEYDIAIMIEAFTMEEVNNTIGQTTSLRITIVLVLATPSVFLIWSIVLFTSSIVIASIIIAISYSPVISFTLLTLSRSFILFATSLVGEPGVTATSVRALAICEA